MARSADLLAGDGLWAAIVRQTDRALASGALEPIATEQHVVADAGLHFVVRVVSSLARKQRQRPRQAREAGGEPDTDPFLPHDPELFVADLGPTHMLLLNRFNVLDHHVLVVTRRFEDQRSRLLPADFAALAMCLDAVDGLGFYNAGAAAGASQSHKHLQVVPLPLARTGPAVPVETLLARARYDGRIGTVPGLDFRHAMIRLDTASSAPTSTLAGRLHDGYRTLLMAAEAGGEGVDDQDRLLAPYNLLTTRSWMLMVPRSREHFRSVSINGLGFAGSMFVRDEAQLQEIAATGPMAVLRHVAIGEGRATGRDRHRM